MCPAHVFFVELFYLITSLFQITLLLVIVELVEHKLHLFIEFLIRSKEEMFGCLVSLSLWGLTAPGYFDQSSSTSWIWNVMI